MVVTLISAFILYTNIRFLTDHTAEIPVRTFNKHGPKGLNYSQQIKMYCNFVVIFFYCLIFSEILFLLIPHAFSNICSILCRIS